MSFLIRAKNEAKNIQKCIESIATIADEIIFVDNQSIDGTFELAQNLSESIPILKCYKFNHEIPPANSESHKENVHKNPNRTLAYYYNWCLNKVTCYNFIKWDADFVALPEQLEQLINNFQLRTRGDNFAVFVGGKAIYEYEEKILLDNDSKYSEFRVFSKKHHAQYVNLEAWEEIDQTYLYKALKLSFDKPIFLEKRDYEYELNNRFFHENDDRDQYSLKLFKDLVAKNILDYTQLDVFESIDEIRLTELFISDYERDCSVQMNFRFNCLPEIYNKKRELVVSSNSNDQKSLVVGILSCEKNQDKINSIRATWAMDLIRLGITYYFIIGREGIKNGTIEGDILYVDSKDNYESLPFKVGQFFNYVRSATSFQYLFKIDDDCILNVEKLVEVPYHKHDYLGQIVGTEESLFDYYWHKGKCEDDGLNNMKYWREWEGSWNGGGLGYFLSSRAMDVLLNQEELLFSDIYEDKTVADILRRSEILPEKNQEYKALEVINNFNQTAEEFIIELGLFELSEQVVITNIQDSSFFYSIYRQIQLLNGINRSDPGFKVISDWDETIKMTKIDEINNDFSLQEYKSDLSRNRIGFSINEDYILNANYYRKAILIESGKATFYQRIGNLLKKIYNYSIHKEIFAFPKLIKRLGIKFYKIGLDLINIDNTLKEDE